MIFNDSEDNASDTMTNTGKVWTKWYRKFVLLTIL